MKKTRPYIAILISQYYPRISQGLLQGAVAVLEEAGYSDKNYDIVRVPGSFEISYMCHILAKSKKYDAIVCLGCLMKGKTKHFDLIAEQVARGIYEASVCYSIPISFGVLTPNSLRDAYMRSKPSSSHNRGRESMQVALQMTKLLSNLV